MPLQVTPSDDTSAGRGPTTEVDAVSPQKLGKGSPPPMPGGKGSPCPGGSKGAGKGGKGVPPPPAKGAPPPAAGKGPGKGAGAPPPAKGGKPPAKGKGKTATAAEEKGSGKATAKAPMSSETPFGRRVHMVQPSYENLDGTVFLEVCDSSVGFDPELLKAILATDKGATSSDSRPRRSLCRKDTGIKVLDASRAQNMAIGLAQFKMTTEELCECLRVLDFSNDRLCIEDLERIHELVPSTEESKKLLEHRERFDELRDIEQKVMPFCTLKRLGPKLRLMNFVLSHAGTYSAHKARCQRLRAALEEVRDSFDFKRILAVFLRIGNYINHGEEGMRDVTVRGFAIESLQTLASFKTGGVGSTLHYVCLQLMRDDQFSLHSFKQSLRHVPEAARETSQALRTDIDKFAKEVQFAEGEFLQLDADSDGFQGLQELLPILQGEAEDLSNKLTGALDLSVEVQRYINHSDKQNASCEDFLKHISVFMEQFEQAWTEIQNNPRKWRQIDKRGSVAQLDKRGSVDSLGGVAERNSFPGSLRPRGRSATVGSTARSAPRPEQLRQLSAAALRMESVSSCPEAEEQLS